MHDSGALDKPREGGAVARIVHAVLQAKDYNDIYLTAVIDADNDARVATVISNCRPASKKAKMNGAKTR